jgi:hypothetical protein
MRTILSRLKKTVATALKAPIMKMGLPLNVQAWAIHRLPLDYWGKSVAYQQCLADRIVEHAGAVVQAGPFAGMKYISDAEEGCVIPKLLGCYEEELAAVVEGFIRTGCDRVVDVGCASGYYVAGFATKLPKAEVFAFDTDENARNRCSQVIARNNLGSQVNLAGLCAPADLESLIKGRTLLVIDCEGSEFDLLDPNKVPALSRCDMIVEIHDFINPKITEALRTRFKDSHSIERIVAKKREPKLDVYPGLKVLPEKHWPAALDERRPVVMDWLIFYSKESGTQSPGERERAASSADREVI